ncbi:MAG: class A beta-lactamase [Mucinivorans sp.]
MKIYLFICTLLCSLNFCFGQTIELKKEIKDIVSGKNLKLGFALYDFSSGKSISINGNDRYPMQSVFKFPIGVALLDCVSRGEFSLTDSLTLTKADLAPELWSPIGERWPDGVSLPLVSVMTYMIAHSDNNATDFLIRKIGGAARIQDIINGLGAKKINIRNTEAEIQGSWLVQFDNWTTPRAMVDLLRLMNDGKLLDKASTAVLWEIMASTSTGSVNRLVPRTVRFVRKTGYSGASSQGVIAAQNDVGIIEFEDGRRVAYAIFLTNSTLGTDAGYDLLAQIGKAIWKAYKLSNFIPERV